MIEGLRRVSVFKPFPEEALQELSSLVVVENSKAGEVIFREGDEGDSAFIILEGKVEIRKKGRTLNRFQTGELFGDKHFDRDIRTADAVSVSDTVLCKIKHVDFKRFLFNHPQSSLEVLWNIIGEVTSRLFKTRQHLVTIFETGKIVSGHLGLSEISEQILRKLLEQVSEASGGMMIVRNPFTDSHEVASAATMTLLDLEGAVQLTENDTSGCICHSLENGIVMVVPLRDEDRILGHILLEKKNQSEPFSVEEEITVSTVGDQVGLGIMNAYNRQEDEARLRLEQGRMTRY